MSKPQLKELFIPHLLITIIELETLIRMVEYNYNIYDNHMCLLAAMVVKILNACVL